ncbi:MAG: hypothetical protein PHP98_10210 [Kiritimatiellae bacterium]|nr:hypothetical protein [Kiritimatiellia bacterium]
MCQKPFADGQIYISSLRLNGPAYERSDCCEHCWKKTPSPDAFSVWKGTFQVVPPPPEVLKKETAESLLRKLIEKNDPVHRNAIFILAVMLERRRILAEKEVRKNDGLAMVRVYEHRKTGETFIVTDPMLNLGELEHVQAEVSSLLSGTDALPPEEDAPHEKEPSGGGN